MEWIQLIATMGVGLLVMFWKNYIPKYLEEKGKNLATKEDITEITSKVESVKLEHSEKLDEIQKKNDLLYSEIKNSKERFNAKQFELYNILWSSLIDLKISADDLWHSATIKKLKFFSNKLFRARLSIEKSSLLLEDKHYKKLIDIIRKFENYKIGKEKLIDLKNELNKDNLYPMSDIEILTFFQNMSIKIEYDELIMVLKNEFKFQIRATN